MRFAFALSLVFGLFGSAGSTRAAEDEVLVRAPAAKETVAKVEEVKGIWTVKDTVPIVFVKPLNGSEYYAQAKCSVDGATFTCNAHFGDEETKPGTGFKLVVVAVPTKEAAKYAEGTKVANLPKGVASKAINVTR